jgi:NADH-quinone oxidoreductase subunit L
MALVFWGKYRGSDLEKPHHSTTPQLIAVKGEYTPHESPRSMTVPLIILAICAIALGAIGTPAWPWFQEFLGDRHGEGFTYEVIRLMVISSLIVFAGVGLGLWLYGRKQRKTADEPDVLEKLPLGMHAWFANKYGIDELYEMTVIRFNAWFAKACAAIDEMFLGFLVLLLSYLAIGLGWVSNAFDNFAINLGFDHGCERVSRSGSLLSRLQNGRVQIYLRVIGVALVVLVLFLIWGGGK